MCMDARQIVKKVLLDNSAREDVLVKFLETWVKNNPDEVRRINRIQELVNKIQENKHGNVQN